MSPTFSPAASPDLEGLQENVKLLSASVDSLASELAMIKERQQNYHQVGASPTDPCFLYVKVVSQHLRERLGTTTLEEVLHCKVIQYTLISDLPSLKVKIQKKDLYRALLSDKKLLKVRLWKSNLSSPPGPK